MSLLRRIGSNAGPHIEGRYTNVELDLLYTVQAHVEQMLRENGVWLDPEDEQYLRTIVRVEVRDYFETREIPISTSKQYDLVSMIVARLNP